MGLSWTNLGVEFKSPLRVAAQVLWRSRENKARKCRSLKRQLAEAQRVIARQAVELQRQKEKSRARQECVRRMEAERRPSKARRTTVSWRTAVL